MDAEEIEKFYEKEMDAADRKFLESKKNGAPEKEYKELLKKIREEYDRKYQAYFESQRKAMRSNKKKTKVRKEQYPRLKINALDMNTSFKDKLKMQYDLWSFKMKIHRKEFFRKMTPAFIKIFYLKQKMQLKRFTMFIIQSCKAIFQETKNAAIGLFMNAKDSVVNGCTKAYSTVANVLKRGYSLIPKRKGKEKELTEDQKLAEKILAKKEEDA